MREIRGQERREVQDPSPLGLWELAVSLEGFISRQATTGIQPPSQNSSPCPLRFRMSQHMRGLTPGDSTNHDRFTLILPTPW